MSQVTLRDGSTADVTQDNYRQLAQKQIDLARGQGIVDAATQSSIFEAFKQLAGQQTNSYTYGAGGAVANDNGASAVLNNPLVRGSSNLMDALPDSVRHVWTDSSNAVVSGAKHAEQVVVDDAKAAWVWLGNAGSKLKDLAGSGLTTIQLLAVAGVAIGAAVIIWELKK